MAAVGSRQMNHKDRLSQVRDHNGDLGAEVANCSCPGSCHGRYHADPAASGMAVLVYLLLMVVAANVRRRLLGCPCRAGACVAWR
jgi:hypothetical protein